jgi:putative acetyltransferase
MSGKFKIREFRPGDAGGVVKLYEDAFPDEGLVPLVGELLNLGPGAISLVVSHEDHISGHICFTFCGVENRQDKVALLAPLAVTPALQSQGVGSALIQEGFKYLKKAKFNDVFVLGDPGYYNRFGFQAGYNVTPPYPLPAEWRDAWQSVRLRHADAVLAGRLTVPEARQQKALWGA